MTEKTLQSLFQALLVGGAAAAYAGVIHGFWAGFGMLLFVGLFVFALLTCIHKYFRKEEQEDFKEDVKTRDH
jgi:uncharacterized membrane protein YjjP (DUF1212 family)